MSTRGPKSSALTLMEISERVERREIDKDFVKTYLHHRRSAQTRKLILERIRPEDSKRLILGIPCELFHYEMTPWQFMHYYFNYKERRLVWKLLECGDYEEAFKYARFRYHRNDILSRLNVLIAIIRCAPLAVTPKISAQIMMPIIVQRRIEIALNGKDRDSLTAMQEISDLISNSPVKKSVVLHAELKEGMRFRDEERPWLAVPSPTKMAAVTAIPQEVVERTEEDVSNAASEAIEAAFEVPKP